MTVRRLRGARVALRTTRVTGRFSWRTNTTAAPMKATTTTMTPVAKYPNCLSRRQNVPRRYCPTERSHNVLAGQFPAYRVLRPASRVVVVGVLPDAALDQRLCGHGAEAVR